MRIGKRAVPIGWALLVVEALMVARRHLATADAQRLGYLADLCQKAGDYTTLAEVAREQSNAVQFMAGLLASRAKG